MSGILKTGDKKTQKNKIRVFGLASFLNDMGSDMIYPIWPLFVTSMTGANMAVLGLIDGIGDAVVSLSQAFAGQLSDRLGKRKPFVWIGYVMASVSRLGYSISSGWLHVAGFRILDRAGKIRGAPRDAMIAEISSDSDRGRNFGYLRAMDHLGAVTGVLICLGLASRMEYKEFFMLAAVPSALSAVLIALKTKDIRPKPAVMSGERYGGSIRSIDNNFKLLGLLSVVFSLGSFSYSFLLIGAKEMGFSEVTIPLLYLLFTVTASASSVPFGRLADSFGRKAVLMSALGLWALVGLCMAFGGGKAMAVLAFVFYGLHNGALVPSQRALVAELAPAHMRATCMGWFQMAVGLAALPASLMAGILWERWGMPAAFGVSLALSVLAMGLLLLVREPERKIC